MTRGWLPQTAGSPIPDSGGDAAAVTLPQYHARSTQRNVPQRTHRDATQDIARRWKIALIKLLNAVTFETIQAQ